MNNFPIFIILGVLVLIVVGIFYNRYATKKRREALQSLADELGFTFHPTGDEVLQGWFEGFHLFSQGRTRKINNIIRGKTAALDMAIFDYRYTTGSGKNKKTHSQTVLCFNSDSLSVTSFVLRPESFWHRVGMSLMGGQDIDFDLYPVFSKMFLLRGKDEIAIRETFTPEILEHFEQRPGVSVEADGNLLIYYRNGTIVKPDKVRPFMEEGFETLSLFQKQADTWK